VCVCVCVCPLPAPKLGRTGCCSSWGAWAWPLRSCCRPRRCTPRRPYATRGPSAVQGAGRAGQLVPRLSRPKGVVPKRLALLSTCTEEKEDGPVQPLHPTAHCLITRNGMAGPACMRSVCARAPALACKHWHAQGAPARSLPTAEVLLRASVLCGGKAAGRHANSLYSWAPHNNPPCRGAGAGGVVRLG